MNDEVDSDFYSKWQKIPAAEKAVIEANIEEMKSKDRIGKFQSLVKDLHHLTNLKMIYKKSNVTRKQSLIKRVFKHNLVFKEGLYRTASIEGVFRHNSLILKEKGLIDFDETFLPEASLLSCTPERS